MRAIECVGISNNHIRPRINSEDQYTEPPRGYNRWESCDDVSVFFSADLGPLDDVRIFAETAVSEKNMMVVGHLPFMERLASYLITGSPEIFVSKFQNSGIVCLDQGGGDDEEKGWYIKWTLNPNIS